MVSSSVIGSTVPRRQLGRHLREARNRARLTVQAAAAALEWSETKIWRIETGQSAIRSLDVNAICSVYGVPTDLTAALMGLAKETKARGWWQSYGDAVPTWFDVYLGLEEAARRLCWYEAELVPGLLQTDDYARILISTDNPDVDAAEIDRRVQLRIARQALLTRAADPPTLDVVVSEAVIHRAIGGERVLAGQLNRMLEMADLPNVRIRVVPFGAGLHYGVICGPFTLLEFAANGNGTPTEPPTVYVEGFTGALYLEKDNEIARYRMAFDAIWNTALTESKSRTLVSRITKELR